MTRSRNAVAGRAGGSQGRGAPEPRLSPKAIRVVLPVWGPAHVRRFLASCAPTLLAPGNLPALAASLPCGFTVMTSRADAAVISGDPIWRRLTKVCEASLVPIDDIVSETSYAVTITLAYARAILATGTDMPDTCFIFLVADYVLADGSLAAVLARLTGGASGVLAGNFQVDAEGASAAVAPWRDARSGVLAIPSRDLVRCALQHMHEDTVQTIVNGASRATASTNRLFWRADSETLVGRFYLLHMVGIRPEVDDFTIGSACDYSFIPELCPSGNVVVLEDSDDYFVAEMQAQDGRSGTRARWQAFDPQRLGADLSEWTTARHRENARSRLLFHASELSEHARELAADTDRVVEAIGRNFSRTPVSHRDHPYWIGGLALHRAATGRSLPACSVGVGAGRNVAARLLWRLRLSGFGRPPDVRSWHPRWADFAATRLTLRRLLGRTGRLLIVAGEPASYTAWLSDIGEARDGMTLARLSEDSLGPAGPPAKAYDACLIVLADPSPPAAMHLAARATAWLKPAGVMTILVGEDFADAVQPFDSHVLLASGADWRARGWTMRALPVPAGRLRHDVQRGLFRFAQQMRRCYGMRFALYSLGTFALAVASLVCNLGALRSARRGPDGRCSSVLLVLRPVQPVQDINPHPSGTRAGETPAGAKRSEYATLSFVLAERGSPTMPSGSPAARTWRQSDRALRSG